MNKSSTYLLNIAFIRWRSPKRPGSFGCHRNEWVKECYYYSFGCHRNEWVKECYYNYLSLRTKVEDGWFTIAVSLSLCDCAVIYSSIVGVYLKSICLRCVIITISV